MLFRQNVHYSLRDTTPVTGVVPMADVPVYQLDNVGDSAGSISSLFNGILNEDLDEGFGKVDPNDVFVWEIYKSYSHLHITKIRLYQYEGSSDQATVFNALTEYGGTPTLLASFEGGGFEDWIEYDVDVDNIRYITMTVGGRMPGEMEVTGTYTVAPYYKLTKPAARDFWNGLGVNTFEWNVLTGDGSAIDDVKLAAMETFSQVRHYLDWDKLEHIQGEYCFQPASSGGWMYDTLYEGLAGVGIDILTCVKTQPAWVQATYPEEDVNDENAPVLWVDGAQASLSDPASYTDYAKVLFQYAGRYGSNTGLDTSLLHPNTQPKQFSQPGFDNVLEVGLGYVHYIEVNNETDRWWKGLLSYQHANEYAANLSACYDGHLNTMGDGVGIRNADPTMNVVMAGTAGVVPDYIMGIADWSIKNRGYNTDGTINLPCDVINVHCYSGDSQGIAPELGPLTSMIPILQQGKILNIPVWLTEVGYDDGAGSSISVPNIGEKTEDLVKADWILRTALMANRIGVDRTFFYQDYDEVPGGTGQYATSGLLDATLDTKRKPAGDYIYQAKNLMAGYTFVRSSIDGNGSIIDVYNNGAKNAYVLTAPSATGFEHFVTLTPETTFVAYVPTAGQDSMTNVGTDTTAFLVTETPTFIILDS